MGESRISQLRNFYYENPSLKFNVTTKERKEILLSSDSTVIYHGNIHDIKFKNKGGGVWEMYCEKREYSKK